MTNLPALRNATAEDLAIQRKQILSVIQAEVYEPKPAQEAVAFAQDVKAVCGRVKPFYLGSGFNREYFDWRFAELDGYRAAGMAIAKIMYQGKRGDLSQVAISLEDLQITLSDSSRWQRLASVLNDGWQEWRLTLLSEERYPTMQAALELAGGEDDEITNWDHVKVIHGRFEDYDDLGLFDLVVTDPPYGVTSLAWDKAEHWEWLQRITSLLKPKYNFFWFCPASLVTDTELMFRELGLEVQSRIVWARRNMALGSKSKMRFVDTWEMALHAGNRELNFPSTWSDAWFDSQSTEEVPLDDQFTDYQEVAVPQSNFKDTKLHPTQKPKELIRRLVEFGSYAGDRILDPFAGSGTAGFVTPTDRECVLIEQSIDYVNIINRRLGKEL